MQKTITLYCKIGNIANLLSPHYLAAKHNGQIVLLCIAVKRKFVRMKNCLSITLLLALFSLTAFGQGGNKVTFVINVSKPVQTIRNIGASACWYGEEIGAKWPDAEKQKIAELLFSRGFDNMGNPTGIGISAFRFNIGGGTAEQGDSSGIKEPARRVECFLAPDGTYNWDKQKGYTWLLQQAKNHGVENLIAFSNTPPVQFTKNGLGFKLEKDYISNLREDKYGAYADFLAEVIKHYDSKNLHFNYISPINEPQWDWSGVPGQAGQEGSPWTNQEMYNTVKAVNQSLANNKLNTKILITEAGTLSHLYEVNSKSGHQVQSFFSPASPLYVGKLSNMAPVAEGHGYFTEVGDAHTVEVRARLRDSIKQYGPGLEFWQSEYCMLGDGFKDGEKVNKRSAMDCALYLAKIINTDFTVANATAWHFWNSFEPNAADSNTLYYLIALNPNRTTSGNNLFTVTKNLWALGHYSRFIRPGMQRVTVTRDDKKDDAAAMKDIMISAFRDKEGRNIVVNVINYTTQDRELSFPMEGVTSFLHLVGRYITSAKQGDDMKAYPVVGDGITVVPARSIYLFV